MASRLGRSIKNNKISNRYCCVPKCQGVQIGGISLHLLPTDTELRKKWIKVLAYEKKLPKYLFVCSQHFKKDDYILPYAPTKRRSLKKGAVPSIKLPVTAERSSHYLSVTSESVIGAEVEVSTTFTRLSSTSLLECNQRDPAVDMDLACNIKIKIEENAEAEVDYLKMRLVTGKLILDEHSYSMPSKTIRVGVQTDPPTLIEQAVQTAFLDKEKQFCIIDSFLTDKDLNTFTGIDSFETLNAVEECVNKILSSGIKCTVKKKSACSLRNKIIMTLMKLKTSGTFTFLSRLLNISPVTYANYYDEMIPILAAVLKNVWNPRNVNDRNMLECFREYHLKNKNIVLSK